MKVKDGKSNKIIELYFICKGYEQTGKLYTTEYQYSELYLNLIKRSGPIEFIKDPHKPGNWFQYDKERPKILPPWFFKDKQELVMRGYKFEDLDRLGISQMAKNFLRGAI